MTRRSSWGKPGSVYFILDAKAQAIKIGFSTNVPERLGALQTSTVNKLELLGTMPGSVYTEQNLHKQFDRLHGEWFAITSTLIDFIRTKTEATPAFHALAFEPEKQNTNVPPQVQFKIVQSPRSALHEAMAIVIVALLFHGAAMTLFYILIPVFYAAAGYIVPEWKIILGYVAICAWVFTRRYRNEMIPQPQYQPKPRVDRQTRLRQKWELEA